MSKRNFSTSCLLIERLREVLYYDLETGVFTWRIQASNCVTVGSVAGSLDAYGYRVISIDGVRHKAHRLAFYYVTGAESVCEELDHIDQNKSNNAFANLRESSSGENKQNTGKQSNNSSGVKGVRWSTSTKKWQARICSEGKQYYLGYFRRIEDAAAARKAAEILYHPFRPTSESP